MTHALSRCLAVAALSLAVAQPTAAVPSVTDRAEWDLAGKLKGHALLACTDESPAPETPVQQPLPSPVSSASWVAKIQFSTTGDFRYWEVDANSRQLPLHRWASYAGTWEQHGSHFALRLDDKSAAKLEGTLDGGSKCGGSAPCYDTKRYKLSGVMRASGRLSLTESLIFGVNNIQAPKQYKCHGKWTFTKSYKSD